jgi:hypothetical protein
MIHLASLETTNSKLAAALTAVGIPLKKSKPVQIVTGGKGPDRVAYFFEAKSPCGAYDTKELMLAWENDEWHARNPEHPFAYLKVGMQNLDRLNEYCRKGTPIAYVQRGSKIAFLSLNASDDLQKKVFAELKR